MKVRSLCCQLFAVFTLWLGAAVPAMAHPGHPHGTEEVDEFEKSAFTAAVQHPFTGVDHALAALAVGAIAFAGRCRLGSRSATAFLLSLSGGLALGRAGLTLPGMEQGLAASVILAGVALAGFNRVKAPVILAVGALVGLWHGVAHGSEMAVSVNTWAYGAGMVAGSALLVALGAAMAYGFTTLSKHPLPLFERVAGASFSLAGLWLLAGTFP